MRTSQKGIDLIKKYEGFCAVPYLDAVKVPTIGYGTTRYPDGRRVQLSDPTIDEIQATEFLMGNLTQFERHVERLTSAKLTQNQFDALVSFAYNLGAGALQRSTLLKVINHDPKDPTIPYEFCKWTRAGEKRYGGLAKRRLEEAVLYYLND